MRMLVSEVNALQKACFGSRFLKTGSLLGFDRTCVDIHQKQVCIKSSIVMADNDFLLSCNIDCKKHIAGHAMYNRDFNKRLCKKVLRANGGIDPKFNFQLR